MQNFSLLKTSGAKKIGFIALFVLAVFAGYVGGYKQGSANLASVPAYILNQSSSGDPSMAVADSARAVDFAEFWKTWNILETNFAPTSTSSAATSTDQTRLAGAIAGLAASYNDPYTVFIPKEQEADFKQMVNAEFEGIGAVIANNDAGEFGVAGILPKSPAEAAGLLPGDRLLAVDANPVEGQELTNVVSHIRGPKGTVVTLTIARGKSQKESTIEITRGVVTIPTTATKVVTATKSVLAAAVAKASAAAAALTGKAREEAEAKVAETAKQQFFVLQLATFAKTSTDAFVSDLARFAQSDTNNLIIDLRNNPGGYLDTAQDLASYFLPKDAVVVSERHGANSIVTEYRSRGYDVLKDKPLEKRRIVVLLNRNSASASEILAGALQDYKAAKVVGEQSFGKGSVQTVIDIGAVGSLKVTIARWYTPLGKTISHVGITPDIVVDLKDPKYASSTDPYMDAAVETLLDDSQWK
jgi:carboxyl-terminal processing protease